MFDYEKNSNNDVFSWRSFVFSIINNIDLCEKYYVFFRVYCLNNSEYLESYKGQYDF